MNYKTTTLILSALILFVGCSDSKIQNSEAKEPKKTLDIIKVEAVAKKEQAIIKKDYTIGEIYNSMCIECHSADGTGNTEKLTPSMANLTEMEMITALKEVEADQGHVIMEHNRGEIIKMGMEYSADDMAKYMHQRFNNKSE